jgi:hypothetical protein
MSCLVPRVCGPPCVGVFPPPPPPLPTFLVLSLQEQGSLANALTRTQVLSQGPVKSAHDGFEHHRVSENKDRSVPGVGVNNIARQQGKAQWMAALRDAKLMPPKPEASSNPLSTKPSAPPALPPQAQTFKYGAQSWVVRPGFPLPFPLCCSSTRVGSTPPRPGVIRAVA